jgi:hypothetical protein
MSRAEEISFARLLAACERLAFEQGASPDGECVPRQLDAKDVQKLSKVLRTRHACVRV